MKADVISYNTCISAYEKLLGVVVPLLSLVDVGKWAKQHTQRRRLIMVRFGLSSSNSAMERNWSRGFWLQAHQMEAVPAAAG